MRRACFWPSESPTQSFRESHIGRIWDISKTTCLQDFGRHVERRAAQRLRQALRLQRARKAEVRDLEHRRRGGVQQEEILRLQVALDEYKEDAAGGMAA